MNVSVAAAILILKLKDNFKLPILGYRIKKRKKTQNYENKLFALITVITTSLSTNNRTASGCFSEQNLNRI
jgi:hypothetical protein